MMDRTMRGMRESSLRHAPSRPPASRSCETVTERNVTGVWGVTLSDALTKRSLCHCVSTGSSGSLSYCSLTGNCTKCLTYAVLKPPPPSNWGYFNFNSTPSS